MTARFVAYYRCSTQSQGASGLGLEAQKRAVADYLNGGSWELVGEFEEVESGKRADRPALGAAIELCRLTGARLIIAKLDRLSRDLHFLTGLMNEGVDFTACDIPDANKLTVHILMAVAQQEREAISARTKAALGSIKVRLAEPGGVHVSRRSGKPLTKLGSPLGVLTTSRPDLGTKAIKAKADQFAAKVRPTIAGLQAEGMSLGAIAARLNEMRVQTARGSSWTPMAVKRVLARG